MLQVSRILCPIDFSDHSKVALTYAEDMARELEAELVVCHIVESAVYPAAYSAVAMAAVNVNLEEDAKKAAAEALVPVVEEIRERGLACSALVDAGTASLRIVEIVEEHGIDMVVLATHGYTGLRHVLMGSTAERVVRLSPCPVLSVKSPG